MEARDTRQALGKWGEDLACDTLRGRGYVILARRYRTRAGEIDIIARDGPTVVFVEVKTRADARFGGGAAAITRLKQQKLAQVAVDFLVRARWTDKPCRFDVVVVDRDPDRVSVRVFANAFAVSSYV